MERYQKTIAQKVTLCGKGLHSDQVTRIDLSPAFPDTGLCFRHPGGDIFRASGASIASTELATTIAHNASRIATVEHFLAACGGLGITNLLIEVHGNEMPILDGSAKDFYELLAPHIVYQSSYADVLYVTKRFEWKVGSKWAVVEPAERLEITGSIDWDHPAIGFQEFSYKDGVTDFSEIASARTFGFLRDVERLRKAGLVQGGSLENAVVLDTARVINPEGLRYPDEFARHKVLDALGDFQLAGAYICGRFRLYRAGHDLHARIVRDLLTVPGLTQHVRPLDAFVAVG